MRRFLLLLLSLVALLPALAQAPACTGLCLQQVSCPAGQTTSISGTVYAPNGVDPLPNVLVFIPNAPVAAFTPGVQCTAPGTAPSGSPLVGTMSAADGTFTIPNVPVGANIPLVIQAGKWRRQVILPSTVACTNTTIAADTTRFPRDQSEGDIPQFAIATGRFDSVECVLRKVGVADREFTNPLATGRIHLYEGQGLFPGTAPLGGAVIDSNTPSQTTLMADSATLRRYDVILLPCQGSNGNQATDANQNANLLQYLNSGGRVYANHWSYVWLASNASLTSAATFASSSNYLPTAVAKVNTTNSSGSTLASWLQTVGASTTPGQISLTEVYPQTTGLGAGTQPILNLNTPGNPVVQFTFNTPIGTASQCGRVLFNDYHVETPVNPGISGATFPTECAGSTGVLTPQDKLLEYSLFDLSNTGGVPTLSPTSVDFGNQALGFTSAGQVFTWTNNSIFAVSVASVTATGDFVVTRNTCNNVAAGTSCQVTVAYRPSALGKSAGSLKIVSNASTLTADLAGNGVPALSVTPSTLSFGNTDVGATATQNLTVTNVANGPVALGAIALTGDYKASTTCPASIPAAATCTVSIGFTPTVTGARSGSAVINGSSVALAGNGVDFTIAMRPDSGTVVAGIDITTPVSVLPVAGYSAAVSVTCTTNAPASTCKLNKPSFVPSDAAAAAVTITTTSRYTVVGYGGFGRGVLLFACGTSTILLLFAGRRYRGVRLVAGLLVCSAAGGLVQGCSGKLPNENSSYTAAGPYTYTVTATDGFLSHSATFTLNVTAK